MIPVKAAAFMFLFFLVIAIIASITPCSAAKYAEITLEPTFLSDGRLKVKVKLRVNGNIFEDSMILSETKFCPREYGYAVFTLRHVLEKYYSKLYKHTIKIAVNVPKDYIVISPIFYRYDLDISYSNEYTKYEVEVDYSDFSKFVFYEAYIVGLAEVISIYDGELFKVAFTNDVPKSFVENIIDAYSKGIKMLINYLGHSPLQPRVVIISGPNHHKLYPEGHAGTFAGSTVYLKLFSSEAYGLEWYVKNLYHEMAHGWFTWPIIYGDFVVKEGGAEYVSWIITRILYPDLFRKYDINNIKYRVKNKEDYATAAIKYMALNCSLVHVSEKYGKSFNIFDYIRYIIDKYHYSGKEINWDDFIGSNLREFLAEHVSSSEASKLQSAIAYGFLNLDIKYYGTWKYFDQYQLIKRIDEFLMEGAYETVTVTITETATVTTTVTDTVTVTRTYTTTTTETVTKIQERIEKEIHPITYVVSISAIIALTISIIMLKENKLD